MAKGSGRHRAIVAAASVLAAGLLSSAGASGVDARPTVVVRQAAPPSVDAASIGGSGSSNATVSGDGRFVVFEGTPGDEGDSRATTIYLTDRESSVTAEITPVPSGLRTGNSINPVISGDGCTVVLVTEMALDVFRDDDTGDRWDVYRSRLPHCGAATDGWELISTSDDGSALARDDVDIIDPPAVSRDGTVVAYTHPADQVVEQEGLHSITVVDLARPPGHPDRAVVAAGMPLSAPDTQFVHTGLDQPALSGDGRYLAYRSDALSTDAVPGWGTGPEPGGPATGQVFIWDRDEADPFLAVTLASARPDGSPAAAGAAEPVLSRTGRILAFTSADLGLVPAVFPTCTTGCPTQVYRLDRDVDENRWLDEAGGTALALISAAPDTDPLVAGTAPSSQPTVSADGQLVAFITKATNLQAIQSSGGGEPADGDLLVADAVLGTLRRVTVTSDGVHPAVAAHSGPQLSDTGRTTVFDSLAAGQLLPEAGPGRQVVSIATQPSLSLADTDLGTTLVGLQSDEWYVAIINNGPTSFTPAEISVSDGHFKINEDTSTCSLSVAVPPGGDCTVKVTFTPSAPGPLSATLRVAEQGFQAVSVSARLQGAGGEPTLRANPAGAELGSVVVGQLSNEVQFDVENISLLPTSIGDVRLGGANPGDFAITSESCINRPLNPKSTCSVGVTFIPTEPGRRTALIEVVTTTGQYTTVVAAGDAHYEPELVLPDAELRAGDDFVAGGTGYPPNTDVTIVFGDGVGESVTVRTNAEGGFLVHAPLASNEHGGQRTIVVQAADGTTASAPVDVVEQPNTDMIGVPGFGLGG